MEYFAEIDGLRAIAVLSVFLYHLQILGFTGGFVGVDIFFVISGYLITSIISKGLQDQTFTFAKFYERRMRRIIPALYVVLICSGIFTFRFFMPTELVDFCKSLISSLLFFSNILFCRHSGYFDLNSELKPLLHTWSLAIEEQFYIFFPILMFLLYRYARKFIVPILTVFFVVSFGLGLWILGKNPSSAFYLMHYRAWELLMGSIIALSTFPKNIKRTISEGLAILGLGMIGWSIFALSTTSKFPGFNAAIPCLGTALIIYTTVHFKKTYIGKLLGTPPFTFVGKISYSLYLWHWPAIVFMKYYRVFPLHPMDKLWIVVVVFVLSFCSQKWIEQPFRKKEKVFANTKFVLASLATLTFLMVIYSYVGGYVKKGLPSRLPSYVLAYANGSDDINPDRKRCHIQGLKRVSDDDMCILGEKKKDEKPKFIVWGDSHAEALMPAFQMLAKTKNEYGVFASASACPPLLDVVRTDNPTHSQQCEKFNDLMIKYIREHSIPNVVLVSRWGIVGVHYKEETENHQNTDDQSKIFEYGLESTLKNIRESHAKIWLMDRVPVTDYEIPSALGRFAMFGKPTSELEIDFEKYQEYANEFNVILEKMKPKYDFVVLHPSSMLCSKERQKCKVEDDGKSLYRDHQHLSSYGARYVSPVFQPLFDSMTHDAD
jgi:peptidoglycan/LPS O-acetylase OafA/YrhL